MFSEKNQQNKVDLLRSELAEHKHLLSEYKSKLESSQPAGIQKKDIDSIRTELAEHKHILSEYKSKLESSQPAGMQKKDIDSIRSEFAEHKSKLDAMVDEITVFLGVINSINEEIGRIKKKLGMTK